MSAVESDWRLSAAGRDAIAELARLERECLVDPWTAADLALYLGSGAIVGWLLAAGATPQRAVGYAIFQLLPGEAELLRFGVETAERRRGLGRRLLAACLDELAAGGRPLCHLEVRAGNRAARALYERLGFRLVGLRRSYYADGEDAVRYRRDSPLDVG